MLPLQGTQGTQGTQGAPVAEDLKPMKTTHEFRNSGLNHHKLAMFGYFNSGILALKRLEPPQVSCLAYLGSSTHCGVHLQAPFFGGQVCEHCIKVLYKNCDKPMGALGIENGGSDDTLAYLGIVPCSALSYWEVFVKRKRI